MSKSNSILELNDVIKFNGLRGNALPDTHADARFKILSISVAGVITLMFSLTGDTPFRLYDTSVRYSDAIAMIEDNVWEIVGE